LRVVFVGINPSLESARVGHHFAGPGNPFWRLLHAARFTPALLRPEEDRTLPRLGLGLTNVCPRATRGAADLVRRDYERGVLELVRKLEAFRPAVVALVGVTLARVVLPDSEEVGPGPRSASLAGARVFVLPNPSGRNAAFPGFAIKRVWFGKLRRFAEPLSPRGSPRPPARRSRPARSRPAG
jgi:TDG/mug DNA glycosylase family protein